MILRIVTRSWFAGATPPPSSAVYHAPFRTGKSNVAHSKKATLAATAKPTGSKAVKQYQEEMEALAKRVRVAFFLLVAFFPFGYMSHVFVVPPFSVFQCVIRSYELILHEFSLLAFRCMSGVYWGCLEVGLHRRAWTWRRRGSEYCKPLDA